jgi:5-methylcytosine-specific restriction protein A
MTFTDSRRASQRQRGYTRRWQKARLVFLTEHPLCLGCRAIGQDKVAELVDHVEPHRGDMIKFWNAAMWQSSCSWHHDVVKKQLEAMYERGSLTLADLWLNSETAIKLSRQRQAKPIGLDGWPT